MQPSDRKRSPHFDRAQVDVGSAGGAARGRRLTGAALDRAPVEVTLTWVSAAAQHCAADGLQQGSPVRSGLPIGFAQGRAPGA